MKTLNLNEGAHRLLKCKAWYYVDRSRYIYRDVSPLYCTDYMDVELESYNTPIITMKSAKTYNNEGEVTKDEITIVVHENPRYSATTSQHVWKFLKCYFPLYSQWDIQLIMDACCLMWRMRYKCRPDIRFNIDSRLFTIVRI